MGAQCRKPRSGQASLLEGKGSSPAGSLPRGEVGMRLTHCAWARVGCARAPVCPQDALEGQDVVGLVGGYQVGHRQHLRVALVRRRLLLAGRSNRFAKWRKVKQASYFYASSLKYARTRGSALVPDYRPCQAAGRLSATCSCTRQTVYGAPVSLCAHARQATRRQRARQRQANPHWESRCHHY